MLMKRHILSSCRNVAVDKRITVSSFYELQQRTLFVSCKCLANSPVSLDKISVLNPIVELDGDEATRSVWKMVKDKLILPYIDVPVQYYDLALDSRISSNDQVTVDAAKAIKSCGVGIKCSTVDITADMIEKRSLVRLWKSAVVFDRERSLRSATSTLRSLMEGANFRTPIILKSIPKAVPGWTKPIVIARHVYADQFRATDLAVQKGSKLQLLITPDDNSAPKALDIHAYGSGDGVALAMYNETAKITGFAHACFQYALDVKLPLYLGTKHFLLKDYDGAFVKAFDDIYEVYRSAFDAAGIWYESTNIDRMIAFTMRSEGGFVLACKNYDGAMLSEMVATGFGSAELMSSVVASPDGKTIMAESFHPGNTGKKVETPVMNPLSSIFAWIRGLQHRAKLDGNFELKTFADMLEGASLETVEAGKITRDLVLVGGAGARNEFLSSEELIDAISHTLQDRLIRGAKIIYTLTDEAPMLATYAFLPIVKSFVKKHGIEIELKDISVASRIIAAFSDKLPPEKVQSDALAELGDLATKPHANIVKLPNISASMPQLLACISELQSHGYAIPDYPTAPGNDDERQIQAKYAKVLGSAVNPVLREGNSDRRAADAVKQYAKMHPHSMGKWRPDSKTHIAHMQRGDFYESEKSVVMDSACDVKIELVADDGTNTALKTKTSLIPGEVIDGAFMSKRELREFYKREIEDAKKQNILLSLHLKATMMKVSDPIMFGHMVEVFFDDVFQKHGGVLKELGAKSSNGFGDVLAKISKLPDAKRAAVDADIQAVFAKQPRLAMVDSDKGITNLHVPSDVIIDASMPAMIRASGQMWTADNTLEDTKALIPDRCYAGIYHEVVENCKAHGAFDPTTMGTVPNVGLMAQKAEEYGSHDKTFIIQKPGKVRVVRTDTGEVLMEHKVEEGDIWRMCQTKDVPVQDWVRLAVARARATGAKTIFWLDPNRSHDVVMIDKVKQYLSKHDVSGLDIDIMSPSDACRVSCDRARKGLDTISVTGNVLRDYNTDLFPIIELGTSAKMLSIVPMLAGGGMYETGAGGSAPKHVQQLVEENHLRWDSLGEYLALAVSLEDLGTKTKNVKTKILADCLNQATGKFLEANKNPRRKVGQLDNRGSHFYIALYWSQALAQQTLDIELQSQFTRISKELEDSEAIIIGDLLKCQGQSVDIGGYYHPDPQKVQAVMRPSEVFNAILTLGANW